MSRGPPQPRPDYNSHQRWRGHFRVPRRKSRRPPRRTRSRGSGPASHVRPRVSADLERVPLWGSQWSPEAHAGERPTRGETLAPGPMGDGRAGVGGTSGRVVKGWARGLLDGGRGCTPPRLSRAAASGRVSGWRPWPGAAGASEETSRVKAEPGTKSSSGSGLSSAFPARARCHASSLLHLLSDLLCL